MANCSLKYPFNLAVCNAFSIHFNATACVDCIYISICETVTIVAAALRWDTTYKT